MYAATRRKATSTHRWSWRSTTRRIDSVLRSTRLTASRNCSGSARTPNKNSAISKSHADVMLTSTGSTVLRLAVGSGLAKITEVGHPLELKRADHAAGCNGYEFHSYPQDC